MLPHYDESSHSLFEKLKGVWLILCFFPFMALHAVLINVVQILFYPLKWIAPQRFRELNWGLGGSWWGLAVIIMEKFRKIEVEFTGEKTPIKETVIIIANHQAMADVTPIFSLAYRKKRVGQLKWFAKDVLKYVPGMGWGLYIAGNFFVKRNWMRDQKKMDQIFAKVLENKEPMWLVSFLEGTRITAEKLKRSQKFCMDRHRPVLEHLLAPRTKGFEAVVQSLRSHLDAVYDVTIAFPEGTPSMIHLFGGYIHKINVHVRRFPISNLPSDQELGEWVWKVFAEKDELLKYFLKHKAFPGPLISDPI